MTLAGAERVRFASSTPAGFTDILANGHAGTVDVEGLLVLPPATRGPVPLVIASLGSLGLSSGREELYANAFAAAGIATLVVDSFGARGIAETFSDQGRLSLATSCVDGLNALRHLARDERIDPDRIALFGYSRGGCAVVLSDDERLAGPVLGNAVRFAAYVALYPSVWMRWANPQPAPGRILVVFAENDIMVPLPLGRLRAEALSAAGAQVETAVIEEASHSFDSNEPLAFKNEMNMCDCDVVLADDGSMEERTAGLRFAGDWPVFVGELRRACGKLGAAVGYGPPPRNVAVAPIVEFLGRTFAAERKGTR
jgi:dienelactone hydrolase